MNGRKPQLLVDPRVDLSSRQAARDPGRCILSLVEPLPEEPWTVPQEQWLEHVDLSSIPPPLSEPAQ